MSAPGLGQSPLVGRRNWSRWYPGLTVLTDPDYCKDWHAWTMAAYRPDVLTDPGYWTDEPIDED